MSKVPWQVRALPLQDLFEANGIDDVEQVMKYSLLSAPRLAAVVRACIAVTNVDGQTAEVGCASGGTSRLIAQMLGRQHWACDTFDGLVDAGENDPDLSNGDFKNDESTFEGVKARALPNVDVVAGRFPDSAPAEMRGETFALVHLDTDTYQSMRDGFAFFAARMARGGVLIMDDVIGCGTVGAKRFWAEANRKGWRVIEQNDPQVVIRRL